MRSSEAVVRVRDCRTGAERAINERTLVCVPPADLPEKETAAEVSLQVSSSTSAVVRLEYTTDLGRVRQVRADVSELIEHDYLGDPRRRALVQSDDMDPWGRRTWRVVEALIPPALPHDAEDI
jgi:hypothetical protein